MKKKSHKGILRLIIQASFAALTNGYVRGFATGTIFKGNSKTLCVPGMNCYSCPGALFSCPIGSLQAVLGSREFKFSLYVLGFITVFGTLFGRMICGFLCPFGLIQDLLHKIPFVKKLRKLPGEKYLRYIKYAMLLVLVILLPSVLHDVTGLGDPYFCKLVCPVGTLEAGIPLVLMNQSLAGAIGPLFWVKVSILAIVLLGSIVLYRPFCRYTCPLGAIYGLFNRFALYRYEIRTDKCVSCGACQKACPFDINVMKNPNSVDCIRCGRCIHSCPEDAIAPRFIVSLAKKAEKAK